jgi:hypothetical protein
MHENDNPGYETSRWNSEPAKASALDIPTLGWFGFAGFAALRAASPLCG